MIVIKSLLGDRGFGILAGIVLSIIVLPWPARAQEEVASHMGRFQERVRSGYYEGYEVLPRRLEAEQIKARGILRGPFPLSSTSGEVRIRARLADAHSGLKFYKERTCIECHPKQARGLHTVRDGINCRQCHGPEPIPANNHYYSLMNPIRRHAYVCSRCHEGANDLYAKYVIHEPPVGAPETRESFSSLYYTSLAMFLLLIGTIAFFSSHSFLVGFRELFVKKENHAKRIGSKYIKRFSALQRTFHLVLMLTFLIQASTGFSRMFIITPWGERLSNFFGGLETAYLIHQIFGVVMMTGFGLHVIYLVMKIDWNNPAKSIFGPDSILPNLQDAQHLWRRALWSFGLGPPPKLDRWAYWEKFDYWAVFWGIPLLGVTGVMLMFPLLTTRVLPGWVLNIAALLHRAEAILAISYIFIVHFFIGHLRPFTFPMSEAMFSGSVPMEEAIEEKPIWVGRLKKERRIESAAARPPALWYRVLYYVFGFTALSCGIYLLINGIIYSRYLRLH
jgi:cytochrome b subunit of formate dehydrogenase